MGALNAIDAVIGRCRRSTGFGRHDARADAAMAGTAIVGRGPLPLQCRRLGLVASPAIVAAVAANGIRDRILDNYWFGLDRNLP